MSDYRRLVTEVAEWMEHYPQDPDKQALKLVEEIGELLGARLKGKSKAEIGGEYGDVLILLVCLGALHDNIDPLDEALNKIAVVRERRGRVVNGIFRKIEDE